MFRTVVSQNNQLAVDDELKFGERYRHERQDRRISIQPARSPSDSTLGQYKRIVEVDLPNIPVNKYKFDRPCTAPTLTTSLHDGKSKRKRKRRRQPKLPKKRPVCGTLPRKKGCITKTSEMALPTPNRLFATWKDYYHVIPIDFVVRIKQMLNKEICNDPKMCYKYFQNRDCLRKKKKCECKSKRVLKCRKLLKRERHWLCHQIYLMSELLICYLRSFKFGPELTTQQAMMSDILMKILASEGHIKLKLDTKGRPCSDCYHKIGDQLAVWMDDVLRFVDFQASEASKLQPEKESSTSTLSSSLHSSKSYPSLSTITSDAFLISQVSSDSFTSLPSDLSIPSPIPSDLFGLQEVTSSMGKSSDLLESSIAGTIQGYGEDEAGAMDQLENELESAGGMLGESEISARSGAPAVTTDSIDAESVSIKSEQMDLVAKESDIIREVEPQLEVETGGGETEAADADGGLIKEMEKIISQQEEKIDLITEVEEKGKGLGTAIGWQPVIVEPTGSLTEFTDEEQEGGLPTIGMATIIFAHRCSKLFTHKPNKICCLTLRSWAVWLAETANTMHSWTVTLNETIAEVRRTAAILRGQIRDCNGRVITFQRNDWNQLTRKIACLAAAWRQYSRHVENKTDEITICEGMDISCCHKCVHEEIILNTPAAKNIFEKLIRAAKTVSRWKQWLDEIVYETERLSHVNPIPPAARRPCYGPCSRTRMAAGPSRPREFRFPENTNTLQVIMRPDQNTSSLYSIHEM